MEARQAQLEELQARLAEAAAARDEARAEASQLAQALKQQQQERRQASEGQLRDGQGARDMVVACACPGGRTLWRCWVRVTCGVGWSHMPHGLLDCDWLVCVCFHVAGGGHRRMVWQCKG